MRVAVVGGGVMGLSTAVALGQRGHQVTVFEQNFAGHPGGSSHGRSRIVRQAYPDPFYTEVAVEAHRLWADLEQETGRKLVHEVGLLFVGHAEEAELQQERAGLDALGVKYIEVGPEDVRRYHLAMELADGEVALLTHHAGWADVPVVLETLQGLVLANGAEWVRERVDPRALPGFDRIVVTAGAWVTKFAALPVEITRQTVAYIRGEHEGPVWIEGFGDHIYGFPSETGAQTFKVGYHAPGPVTDPDLPAREPDPAAVDAILERVEARFHVHNPQVVELAVCLYSTAPNDDFVIGWMDPRTLVASPCSGHGFKFGPWMGRFLADLVEEKRSIDDWPRWKWSPSATESH